MALKFGTVTTSLNLYNTFDRQGVCEIWDVSVERFIFLITESNLLKTPTTDAICLTLKKTTKHVDTIELDLIDVLNIYNLPSTSSTQDTSILSPGETQIARENLT